MRKFMFFERMGENKVVFKGWLEKCKNVQSSQKGFQLLKGSVSWKRAFFILHCCHDNSILDCYEDESQEHSVPKESLSLGPYYCVYKREGLGKNRKQVFDVTTPAATWRLAAVDQTSLDIWVHYLQIQAKLRNDLPGQYFSVRPGMSESMKRIGAQGQNCLLHVSQWGITLAQEVSRCVLAQWPLKSLRSYGAEEEGKFSFEAGRQAPMGQGVYVFHTHTGMETAIDSLVDTFVQQQTKRSDEEKSGKSPTKQETQVRRKGSSGQEPDPDLTSEYATLRMMTCASAGVSPVDDRHQISHLSFPQDTRAAVFIGSSVSQSQQSTLDSTGAVGQSNVVNIPPSTDSSTYLPMKASWSPRSSTTSQSSSSEYEVMSPQSPDQPSPFPSFSSPPRRSGSFQDVAVFPMSPLSAKSGSFGDVSVFSPLSPPTDGTSSYSASQLSWLGKDSTIQPVTMYKRSVSVDVDRGGQNPFLFERTQIPDVDPVSAANAVSRPALHRSHSEGNIPPPFTNLVSNSPPKLPPKGPPTLAQRVPMSQRTLPPIPGSPLDASVLPFQFPRELYSSESHEYQSLLTPQEIQRLREAEHNYTHLDNKTRSKPEGQGHLATSPRSTQMISTMGAEPALEQGTPPKVKSPKSIKGLVFTRKTKTFVKRSKSSE